jgi:hypothetical protein
MNGKFVIIALVVISFFMSCSKSTTTAPVEQKIYIFQSTGSEPVVPPALQPKLVPVEMSKNTNGIWQATVIVPSTAVPNLNYYTVLFSDNVEIRTGTTVYGDTAVPSNILRIRQIAYPVISQSINKSMVTTITPILNAIRITGIVRPDTVVFSLDPANMTFSVQ